MSIWYLYSGEGSPIFVSFGLWPIDFEFFVVGPKSNNLIDCGWIST